MTIRIPPAFKWSHTPYLNQRRGCSSHRVGSDPYSMMMLAAALLASPCPLPPAPCPLPPAPCPCPGLAVAVVPETLEPSLLLAAAYT